MVVVDAQVMSELVHHGDHHLVGEHLEVFAHVAQRQAVERDAVRQFEAAVVLSLGSRDALVQAEQIFVGMFVVDHQHDVVEKIDEAVWQCVERISHQMFERVRVDWLHDKSVPDRWCPPCRGWEGSSEVE